MKPKFAECKAEKFPKCRQEFLSQWEVDLYNITNCQSCAGITSVPVIRYQGQDRYTNRDGNLPVYSEVSTMPKFSKVPNWGGGWEIEVIKSKVQNIFLSFP